MFIRLRSFCLIIIVISLSACGNRAADDAALFIEAGKFEDALVLLRDAAPADPENERIHLLIGQAYLGLNQLENAKESFREAVRLKGATVRGDIAKAYLAAVRNQLAGSKEPEPFHATYLSEALAYDSKSFPEAWHLATKIVYAQIFPENPDNANREEALKLMDLMASNAGISIAKVAEYHLEIAHLMLDAHRIYESLDHAMLAIELQPEIAIDAASIVSAALDQQLIEDSSYAREVIQEFQSINHPVPKTASVEWYTAFEPRINAAGNDPKLLADLVEFHERNVSHWAATEAASNADRLDWNTVDRGLLELQNEPLGWIRRPSKIPESAYQHTQDSDYIGEGIRMLARHSAKFSDCSHEDEISAVITKRMPQKIKTTQDRKLGYVNEYYRTTRRLDIVRRYIDNFESPKEATITSLVGPAIEVHNSHISDVWDRTEWMGTEKDTNWERALFNRNQFAYLNELLPILSRFELSSYQKLKDQHAALCQELWSRLLAMSDLDDAWESIQERGWGHALLQFQSDLRLCEYPSPEEFLAVKECASKREVPPRECI